MTACYSASTTRTSATASHVSGLLGTQDGPWAAIMTVRASNLAPRHPDLPHHYSTVHTTTGKMEMLATLWGKGAYGHEGIYSMHTLSQNLKKEAEGFPSLDGVRDSTEKIIQLTFLLSLKQQKKLCVRPELYPSEFWKVFCKKKVLVIRSSPQFETCRFLPPLNFSISDSMLGNE